MSENPLEQFIETMGLIAQTDGGPRISGQILGYLLIEGEPRSLQQMVDALRISKASASTNARSLEAKGLLRRVSRMGSRQDQWEVIRDLNSSILATYAARLRHHEQVIREVSETFPEDRRDARERVEGFADFYRQSADFMEEWMARVRCDAASRMTNAGTVTKSKD